MSATRDGISAAQRMAVAMAHHLRDGDLVLTGAQGALPLAACRLAQLTHAPDLWCIAGGSGAVNPALDPVPASSCDEALLRAEAVLPLTDVILVEGRGDLADVFCAGGLQIDARGNCNLVAVGDWAHPHLRGPGTVGLPLLPRAGRVVIYTMAHNPRTFVERVDFLSGPGFLRGPAEWATRDWPGTGPALVVTPLCTMDFDPETLRMRVRTLHPGVELDAVRSATGFELAPPASMPVPVTPEPTEHEMDLLRRIDGAGLLAGR